MRDHYPLPDRDRNTALGALIRLIEKPMEALVGVLGCAIIVLGIVNLCVHGPAVLENIATASASQEVSHAEGL